MDSNDCGTKRMMETQQVLKREIKSLRQQCQDTCDILNNTPQKPLTSNNDEKTEQSLNYVKGLTSEIQNANAIVLENEYLLTSHFLTDLEEKTKQVEDLTAFTRGVILDFDNEMLRLRNKIRIAQEAKKIPELRQKELTTLHLQKAKEQFHMIKSELHGLINSLFPNTSDAIFEFMGLLMAERLNVSTSGYLPVTAVNYQVVQLLRDINVVTVNPYNNMEVKLAY